MITVAFVLSLWSAVAPHYSHGIGRERIAQSLVDSVSEWVDANALPAEFSDPQDLLATISYYVLKESNVSEYPQAFSWDAKAGVSCGILQEPCTFVHASSLNDQVTWWIDKVNKSSLGGVDSDPRRALKRHIEVRRLVDIVNKQYLIQE